mmetsp:Transcript_89224/g.266138  ORF Transcript_89224/g.266138 Transcript_89224/m.266138 type:complete len:415 (-) Transcript_89224:188-1432(-)
MPLGRPVDPLVKRTTAGSSCCNLSTASPSVEPLPCAKSASSTARQGSEEPMECQASAVEAPTSTATALEASATWLTRSRGQWTSAGTTWQPACNTPRKAGAMASPRPMYKTTAALGLGLEAVLVAFARRIASPTAAALRWSSRCDRPNPLPATARRSLLAWPRAAKSRGMGRRQPEVESFTLSRHSAGRPQVSTASAADLERMGNCKTFMEASPATASKRIWKDWASSALDPTTKTFLPVLSVLAHHLPVSVTLAPQWKMTSEVSSPWPLLAAAGSQSARSTARTSSEKVSTGASRSTGTCSFLVEVPSRTAMLAAPYRRRCCRTSSTATQAASKPRWMPSSEHRLSILAASQMDRGGAWAASSFWCTSSNSRSRPFIPLELRCLQNQTPRRLAERHALLRSSFGFWPSLAYFL